MGSLKPIGDKYRSNFAKNLLLYKHHLDVSTISSLCFTIKY